jgi:hypothetical protein
MIRIDVAFTNQRGASSILDLAVHNIKRDKIDLFISFFREHVLNRFNNNRQTANITEILFDFILQFYMTLLTPILDSEFVGMLEHPIESIQALHSLNLIGGGDVGNVVLERPRGEGEEGDGGRREGGEGREGGREAEINRLIDLATVIDLNIDLNANITQQENVDESFRTWFRDGADIIFVFLYDNGHEYDYIELSSEGSDQQLIEAFEKAGVLSE